MKTEAWIKKRIKVLKQDEKKVDKQMKQAIKGCLVYRVINLNILRNKLIGSIVELERVIDK